MIARIQDWETNLRRFLEENRGRAFRWGSFDCCLFACNAVREITNVDLAMNFRGRYRTMLGAMRLAGGSVTEIAQRVALEHGIQLHESWKDMRPGDVALADPEGLGPMLGVLNFNRLLAFASTVGLVEYPASCAMRSWRIG